MGNVFEIKPEADYVYYQYRNEMENFFKAIDKLIEENYFGRDLKDMWSCRDISSSNSVYMYFYARYYLGLIRPVRIDPTDFSTEFASQNIINKYDTALFWDQRFIWDDYGNSSPEIPIALFIIMLRFIYNYGEPTWTHDLMVRYTAAMCNMSPNDVEISFEQDKVIYWLVNSSTCRSFIEYTKTDEYKLNFPYANCYEYRIGTHRKNTNAIDEFMLGYMRPVDWQVYDFDAGKGKDPIKIGTPRVIFITSKDLSVNTTYAGNGRYKIISAFFPNDTAKFNKANIKNKLCDVSGKLL